MSDLTDAEAAAQAVASWPPLTEDQLIALAAIFDTSRPPLAPERCGAETRVPAGTSAGVGAGRDTATT